MTPADAEQRILRILRDEMFLDVPAPDADLFASGAVDSLTFVDLLVHLEEEFGRTLSLAELDLDDLQTIHKIARLVTRNGHRS